MKKNLFNKKQVLIVLSFLIVLIIAIFFRLWKLDSIPPGLYPDEAMNTTDALKTLNNNEYRLFYPENNGREGIFMWLIAFSFYVFGASVWSFRIVSALIGILTVTPLLIISSIIVLFLYKQI